MEDEIKLINSNKYTFTICNADINSRAIKKKPPFNRTQTNYQLIKFHSVQASSTL